MIPPERLRELAAGATLYGHERNAMAAEMLAARETERELVDVLRRNGFRKCDVPACNCDSWHQVDGYAARFREIDDAVGDHNGKTLLQAVQEVVAQRDVARAEAKKYHDALVARHGGEPVALLSELDAARAEVKQWEAKWVVMKDAATAWEALSNARLSERNTARAEVERLRGIKPELPSRPGIWEGSTAARFGIRWNGPQSPIAVPMDDGYWTPWHLAQAECARVAKQRDELIGQAMKLREPIETMRVTRGSFGVGYDQVPDAICRLIGFAKSLVDAIAAEQPKPACRLCNLSMPDGTDGHGLGECVPVCPTCDGSGTAEQPKPAGGA